MQNQWYALRTKSRHEAKVFDRLQSKSFDAFFPQVEVWSRRKDRKKKIMSPLFSGYLFVNCELNKNSWLDIIKTYGVVNLLGISDQPFPIPDEQIESIKTIINANEPFKPHPFLTKGDRVIVVHGSLKGAVGIYNSYDHKRGKLVVSVELLNRSIEVEIDSTCVNPY